MSEPQRDPGRHRQRGQVLAVFIIIAFIVIGMVAIVIDVAWFWTNHQQMQKAADAGALAGAVYLPGDLTSAYASARAEARKNGYVGGVNSVTVTPLQDPSNRRRLRVTITGPVDSYFARAFCLLGGCTEEVTGRAVGVAEFVLPVPMGSPQNYFGVGYLVDATSTTSHGSDSSSRSAGDDTSGGNWSGASNVVSNNNSYASASNNGDSEQWDEFGFSLPGSASSINGIVVHLDDMYNTGSGTNTNCQVRVELTWNEGSSWSSAQLTSAIGTSSSSDYTVGSSSSTAGWGSHDWSRSDMSDGSFRVRLTWLDGTAGCSSSRSVSLDHLWVEVFYGTTTTSVTTAPTDVLSPTGSVLAPQNFWAAMNSQGAPNIQGDAYLTQYETRTSALNQADNTDPDGRYAPDEYYNYAVEIPAGSSGELWIFDAGFCDAGSTTLGTGEFWTVGAPNGYSSREPQSSYYVLYNTNETPYDLGDDTQVATAGDTFEQLSFQDHDLYDAAGLSPSEPDCGAESWHHGWWKIASGLTGGRTYRLHTFTTDPSSASDQNNTTAHNTFALWAASSSGTPRIYGIGAMEAYVRLPGGQNSEFYLAQIEALHAGKTMLIDLWDPGDTGNLSGSLQILQPTSSGYSPATFDYTASQENPSGSSCNSRSGTNVTSVTTNTGGTSLYNGCWLTITIRLPTTYSAPHPSTDSVTDEGGWWKIRYSMGGSTSSYSTDLTTWQVSIRGSPVHLIPDV